MEWLIKKTYGVFHLPQRVGHWPSDVFEGGELRPDLEQ